MLRSEAVGLRFDAVCGELFSLFFATVQFLMDTCLFPFWLLHYADFLCLRRFSEESQKADQVFFAIFSIESG